MPFSERYKVYLDWGVDSTWNWNNDTDASWTEVFPDHKAFQKMLEDKELFTRYKWGEVTFRNKPDGSGDAYELYDIIDALDPAQEIRIKVVTDDNTIRGYFGNNDCDYDDDNKKFTITPTILDQYTVVLENAEKKIDVIGQKVTTTARYELDDPLGTVTIDHNIPIMKVASDIPEAQDPGLVNTPNSGGAFLAITSAIYEASYIIDFRASVVVTPGETIKLYLREYDSSNVLLQERLLNTYTYSSNIVEGFTINDTYAKGSYITFECVFSNPNIDTIEYTSISFRVTLDAAPYSTITVQVNLSSNNLVAKEVWTNDIHGRASPKENDWTNVTDYFEGDGSPKSSLLADPEFGMTTAAGGLFHNELDVLSEPIGSLTFNELETVLGDFGYQASSLEVWEGLTYRQWWPFGTKKRRVFGTCTFTREEYWKVDEGAPDPPQPSAGWEQAENASGEPIFRDDKRLWIRKPFNGSVNTWTLGALDSTGGDNGSFEWESRRKSVINYDLSGNSREFSTVRELRNIIETIYNNMSSTLATKSVLSTFLWNDNEGDLAILDSWPSGTNYVTFAPNELNRIGCIHTSVFDTDETESDRDEQILEVTFRSFMDDLKKLLPIYWFVDTDDNLHIEHIKYLDLTFITVDVRTDPLIDETKKWDYNKAEMFASVNYETVNAGYVDFTNSKVEFTKIASNKRGNDVRLDLKTEILGTDIKYCIENPSDLENGLTLILYDENNVSISEKVPLLDRIFENGGLAISNLLIKYWRYQGVYSIGKINNVDYEFTQTSRTKIGKQFGLKNAYDVDSLGNDVVFVTTDIGIGMVKEMTIDFTRGTTTNIILMYRYESSPDADGFQLIAATDVLYDFGNYEN